MEKSPSLIILLSLAFMFIMDSGLATKVVTYNVGSLGGKADGNTDSIKAFLSAWDKACASEILAFRGPDIEFSNSNNIKVSGLASLNSQMFHIVVNGCHNVKMQSVKVSASGHSPNTDGIHVQISSDVTILNSKIATGDDCVSVGTGTSNFWIQNIICWPGHGISIGSLGKDEEEAGVPNVTVTTSTFVGTQNGLRIKSWGRSSTGFARNILFQYGMMLNVQNPIGIDQNYCPDNKRCAGQISRVKISDLTYQDIHGTSATEVAVKFDCSSKYPFSNIKMEDVKFTYNNRAAEASCSHAGGTGHGSIQPTSCL